MDRFDFRPAMLRDPLSCVVGSLSMECLDARGRQTWRLDWGDILEAAYVEHSAHGARLRRLDLITTEGRRSVSCTGAGDLATDTDASTHLDLVAAILDRLAQRHDGLEVTLGEYGKARLAMFAIGLVSVLACCGIAGLALLSGVSGGRHAEAALPMLLLLAFGAILALGNAPWRRPPTIRAALLAQVLREAARAGTEAQEHAGDARNRLT